MHSYEMLLCEANPFKLVVFFHAVHSKVAIQMTVHCTSHVYFNSLKKKNSIFKKPGLLAK